MWAAASFVQLQAKRRSAVEAAMLWSPGTPSQHEPVWVASFPGDVADAPARGDGHVAAAKHEDISLLPSETPDEEGICWLSWREKFYGLLLIISRRVPNLVNS
ncbi:hypothetical protein BHE74_00027274 [Ensete ventricosum]|nr:hypothetical protein GW17_00053160 [Ensete ventricosum]RWW65426.1 hypothetical protein BHE74_00027274 [Ensete ventricosum]